jgi:pimeloyl-ACP methyl ester carboxylesterase
MAQDQVEVMRQLGHEHFSVAGHDRGGRVAHRMCLDHPGVVKRVVFLDIVPTLTMYNDTSKEFATKCLGGFCTSAGADAGTPDLSWTRSITCAIISMCRERHREM